MTGEQPTLRAALTLICAWELAALTTRRLPTITSLMRRMPPVQRAVIVGLTGAALTDHFFTRRWVR